MKRNTFCLNVLLAAALLAAASCTDESESPLREMTFTASSEASKTCVGDLSQGKREVLWQEYDKVSIFPYMNASSEQAFMIQGGAGTPVATFHGFGNPAPKYYALYPRNAEAQWNFSYETGAKITFGWNVRSQTPTPGSFDPNTALMAASTTGTNFTFRHLSSYVKITTDFSCRKFEVYTSEVDLAPETLELKFDYNENPVLSTTSSSQSGTGVGAAIVAASGSSIAPGTYYIAVYPTKYIHYLDLLVTSESGAVLKRTISLCEGFQAGHILDLGQINASRFTTEVGGFLGTGTSSDPYLIGNMEQFELFLSSMSAKPSTYASKCYRQTADLDFNGKAVCVPSSFSGSYDGGGHKITNVVLAKTKASCDEESDNCYVSALFPMVYGASISNLAIECAGFESNTNAGIMIYGGMVGVAESSSGGRVSITNCSFSPCNSASNVDVGEKPVAFGGMVGYDSGNLICHGCTNNYRIEIHTGRSADVVDSEYSFGGIVGKIHPDSDFDCYCNLDRCRNNVSINITGAPSECFCGGMIGWADEYSTIDDVTTRIVNCVNKGYVAAASATRYHDTASGGLIGYHNSDGGDCGDPVIFNCLNCGDIGGAGKSAYVGGLIGYCYDNDTRICACANVGSSFTDSYCADYPRCGALCGTAQGVYYNCAFTSGSITYDRVYSSDENVHNAYSIDANSPKQLSSEKMTELLNGVTGSPRTDALKACSSFAGWTGIWKSGDNYGLDLDF